MLVRKCHLKRVIEGKIQGRIVVTKHGEEDGSSYWMTLKITGNGKRRHQITLFGTPVLEQPMILSLRQCNEVKNNEMGWARRSYGGEAGFIDFSG